MDIPARRNFGFIRQIGMVVRDPRAAMLYWAEVLGVGPFFVSEKVTFEAYRYRGRPMPSPVVTLGYAQAGDLQIEVISQHDDTPSGYLEFLASGREGLQHLSSWFRDSASYNDAYAAAIGSGAEIVHEGSAGGPRFAYFSTIERRPYGLDFELAEGMLPSLAAVHKLLAEAAHNWDGSDPIRKIGS